MDIELDALANRIRAILQALSPSAGAHGGGSRRDDPAPGDAAAGAGRDHRSPPDRGIEGQLEAIEADLQALRSQRARWIGTEREVMKLLGSETPATIVHDLRNVLNNVAMLKGIVERRRSIDSSRPSGMHP